MRWRDYLGMTAGLMLFGWLRTVWPNRTEIMIAALVAVVVVGTVVERAVRRRRFRHLAGLDADERRVAVEALPASDAALARVAFGISFEPERWDNYAGTREFAYRPGSRSLNTYLFWVCIATAGAMLGPIAVGRADDPGEILVWIVISALLLASGFGYRVLGRDIGAKVVLSPQGIALVGAGPADRALDWLEIATIRWLRGPAGLYRGMELWSAVEARLLLDSRIPDYDTIVENVVGKLVAIHRVS